MKMFLASVSGILRYKVMGYEDVFVTILIKKCLPIGSIEL